MHFIKRRSPVTSSFSSEMVTHRPYMAYMPYRAYKFGGGHGARFLSGDQGAFLNGKARWVRLLNHYDYSFFALPRLQRNLRFSFQPPLVPQDLRRAAGGECFASDR